MECCVKISTVEDLMELHTIMEDTPANFDVISGSIVIDGRSFLGLLSLISANRLRIRIMTPDKSIVEGFIKRIKKFLVKKQ